MIITTDGPAGAGKSTVSRALPTRLGYRYLDVDYEDDATYDVAQAGPTLGLAIRL